MIMEWILTYIYFVSALVKQTWLRKFASNYNMKTFNMLKIITIAYLIQSSFCANILFVGLVGSPSHDIWNEVLVDGLLGNGHNITKLRTSPGKINHLNYTALHVNVNPLMDSMSSLIEEAPDEHTLSGIISLWRYAIFMCNYCFATKEFKAILDYPKDFFDLIIFDVTFSYCYYPLIDHFSQPLVIGVTAFGMQPYINEMIGQRTESYVPFYSLPYTNDMSFFQRFNNVIHQTLERFCKWYFMRQVTQDVKVFYGKDISNLENYEKSISLIFSNDDPVLDYPRAFPPNVIPIGGIHVRKPKKLDDNLQKIMNAAKDGVIFVSMGSNFNANHYSEHVKNAFVEAFSRLNLTVLWKFENIDVPKNVVFRKWFSQTDILAHPNIKLFITHCGGLSSQETIIRGIPVVGIPLFADQHNKGGKFALIKGGIILKYSELTADILYSAITEVIYNPEYKQNVLKLSNLYKSQPQQPLEKFLLWTEYVLKYGQLDHLSIATRNMRWYEVDNWDIFAFNIVLFAVVIVFLKKLYSLAKKMLARISRQKLKQN